MPFSNRFLPPGFAVMHRRRWLGSAVAATALLAACQPLRPSQWLISTQMLEVALQQRFPRQLPLAGLLQLSLAQPVLELHPQSNQLQALLQAALSGPALGKVYTGQVGLRCRLGFDPASASVRAEDVQVQEVRLDGAPAALAEMFRAYGPYVAEKMLQDWALYTLTEAQREQLRTLGLTVGALTIGVDGLHVALLPAQA